MLTIVWKKKDMRAFIFFCYYLKNVIFKININLCKNISQKQFWLVARFWIGN
jgi:hypothetical protein